MQFHIPDKDKQPIKVVHIASGDLWAGAEVQLWHLAKELHQCTAIRLHVVLLNHGILENRLREKGIDVTIFDERKLNSLRIFFLLQRFLKRVKPDIVHTHRQKENVLGSIAAFLVGRARSIRTVHGGAEFGLKPWQIHKLGYRLLDWICARYLQQKLVAVSYELRDLLGRRFRKEKIAVIENGIDVAAVRNIGSAAVKIPGPVESIKISFAGRLVPVKRIDILIETASLLASNESNGFRFYIFGDGPLKGELCELIRNLGLENRVYVLGFKDNLPAYLARMDMLFVTSDHEGLPIVLLEAMALKIPVVLHVVGGIPEVVNYGECGTLVENQNPLEYARIAESYQANRDPFLDKACKAYLRLTGTYTAKSSASKYQNLYRRMLQR